MKSQEFQENLAKSNERLRNLKKPQGNPKKSVEISEDLRKSQEISGNIQKC